MSLGGAQVSSWGDKNVLEHDGAVGCTLREWYTLKQLRQYILFIYFTAMKKAKMCDPLKITPRRAKGNGD